MRVAFILVLVVVGVIFVPLSVIWALNILFHCDIPMDFVHWMASFILVGALWATRKKD